MDKKNATASDVHENKHFCTQLCCGDGAILCMHQVAGFNITQHRISLFKFFAALACICRLELHSATSAKSRFCSFFISLQNPFFFAFDKSLGLPFGELGVFFLYKKSACILYEKGGYKQAVSTRMEIGYLIIHVPAQIQYGNIPEVEAQNVLGKATVT